MFISVFFLIGFGLLGTGGYFFWQGRQAQRWPTTEGRLTACELTENRSSDGCTWRVEVSYTYTVADRLYEGTRLAFGYAGTSNHENHRAIHDKLRQAAAVQVRYDPRDPSRSVLAGGANRSSLFLIIFGATWLHFTTGFAVLWMTGASPDTSLLNQLQTRP